MLARRQFRPILTLLTAGVLACAATLGGAQTTPAPTAEAQPLTECEVIARINSEVVLACELEWQVKLMIEQRLGQQATEQLMNSPMLAEARNGLLKNLVLSRIEMSLLYADFRSNAPHADIPAIKKQLEVPFEETEIPRLMKSVGVEDRADLEARLHGLGTSVGERREDFFRTMIARSWLTQSAKIDKEVTHEQLLDFYHEHKSDYDQPDRARWEELMTRFDSHGSKGEAYAALARLGNAAYAAANAAATGEPAFAAIAPTSSEGFTAQEGGAHDWTTRGSLAAESVDQALFSLPPGQMSPILEGPLGFHIVRVIERKEAGPTPFRDVQAQIRKDLTDERFNVAINTKITELKRTARLWTVFTGDLSYEQLAALQGEKNKQR